MATVNKDFKVKSGLVVEGTNATVNGNQVLTENASDQYIIDLIGGETLVTSVESTQMEVINGELNIKSGVFDDSGAATTAENNAKSYADGLASNYDPAGAATTAENNAKSYADGLASNYDAAGSATTAENNAKSYADGLASNYDAAGSATTAENNAKSYADSLINDGQTTSTNNWSAYKTSTEIGLAEQDAKDYADTAIANLVDSAPSTLNTLNELAAALQDNPDIITDLQDIAAGKQDTLTAGTGIDISGSSNISVDITDFLGQIAPSGYNVVSLDPDNKLVVPYADFTGYATETYADNAADTAESNANTYTDNAISNGLATGGSIKNAIDGAVPDDTDGLSEGVNNLYYTDYRATQAAATLLTGATKTNIEITGDGSPTNPLVITAENGVADSTTNDLVEDPNATTSSGTMYFTNARAIAAVSGADITPNTVTIDTYRKEEATQQYVASASTVNVHQLSGMYESVKYLVRVVGQDGGVKHSQITEILMTIDGNSNIAITEYGNVHTSTNPLATFSATMLGAGVPTLTATTSVGGCEIIAAATMLSWAD